MKKKLVSKKSKSRLDRIEDSIVTLSDQIKELIDDKKDKWIQEDDSDEEDDDTPLHWFLIKFDDEGDRCRKTGIQKFDVIVVQITDEKYKELIRKQTKGMPNFPEYLVRSSDSDSAYKELMDNLRDGFRQTGYGYGSDFIDMLYYHT